MPNFHYRNFFKLFLVVIVLAIIGVCFYFYQRNHNDDNNNNNSQNSPSQIAVSTSSTLSTYNNFGISFQYPTAWGTPDESFYESNGVPQESIDFSPNNASDTQPLMIYTMQDTDPTGALENETFDQMIARYRTNDSQIYLVKDITANGLPARELFYNSALDGQPYAVSAYFQIGNGLYITFGADSTSVPQTVFDQIISTFTFDTNYVAKMGTTMVDASTSMVVYKNNGIQFEYPQKLATDYADLSIETGVVKEDTSKLDSNGCYPGVIDDRYGRPSTTTIMTINNTSFCYSTGGGVGAGQLYTTYRYTTLRDGNVYSIDYLVHTSNACGAYENSSDLNAPANEKYRECLDFEKNYNELVLEPIQASIGTFGFGD